MIKHERIGNIPPSAQYKLNYIQFELRASRLESFPPNASKLRTSLAELKFAPTRSSLKNKKTLSGLKAGH